MNHEAPRGLVDEEEEEESKDRIVSYIQAGNILDRACPGCDKRFAKPRNLLLHLEVRHCVRLAGRLGETLHLNQLTDNATVTCPVCQMSLSRWVHRRSCRSFGLSHGFTLYLNFS